MLHSTGAFILVSFFSWYSKLANMASSMRYSTASEIKSEASVRRPRFSLCGKICFLNTLLFEKKLLYE